MRQFKVGERVWHPESGTGTVIALTYGSTCPVLVEWDDVDMNPSRFMMTGKYYEDSPCRTLYHSDPGYWPEDEIV